MLTNPAEIEAIVRVVLRRLREHGALVAESKRAFVGHSSTADSSVDSNKPAVQLSSLKSLSWPGKLVTLDAIAGRLEGLQRLQVAAGTVVTPAVQDELRQRGIQLERVSKVDLAEAGQRAQGLLVIAKAELYAQVSGFAEFIAASQNCSADVRRIAAHFNSGGTSAIWSSSTPFAAMQAARSDALLRPAQLARPDDLARAVREVDVNLVIIDAQHWDSSMLLKLTSDWTASHRKGINA